MLLAALLAVWFVGPVVGAEPPPPAGKINLRVLYAGVPGDARTAEFMAFLGKYFTKVGQAPFSQFEPKMADGYDVVIFDAEPKPTPNSIGMPPRPNLPRDYDRATVLIGGAVMVTLPLQTKIDWL
jgi:hypothetical protein